MGKFDKTCKVCGKAYKYCSNCAKYADLPTWMNAYDTDECRQIFKIAVAYYGKTISLNDVRIKLSKFDNSLLDSVIDEDIIKMISDVRNIEKSTKKKVEIKTDNE